jgi:hypothetical protein
MKISHKMFPWKFAPNKPTWTQAKESNLSREWNRFLRLRLCDGRRRFTTAERPSQRCTSSIRWSQPLRLPWATPFGTRLGSRKVSSREPRGDSRQLKGRRSDVRLSYDGRSRSDYLGRPRLGPVSGLVGSRHGSPETASIPETIGEFS